MVVEFAETHRSRYGKANSTEARFDVMSLADGILSL
jgi:hypothetical protein